MQTHFVRTLNTVQATAGIKSGRMHITQTSATHLSREGETERKSGKRGDSILSEFTGIKIKQRKETSGRLEERCVQTRIERGGGEGREREREKE